MNVKERSMRTGCARAAEAGIINISSVVGRPALFGQESP